MNTPLSPVLSLIGRSWWVLLLYGIVAVVFGLIAIARPLAAATALAWAIGVMALLWIGVGSLIYGVLQIVVAWRVRRLR